MDVQQIITWLLVAVAAVYLGRLGWDSWRAMWTSRGGCGSGCAKCITAQIASHRRTPKHDQSAAGAVVPLSTITRPSSRRNG